MQIETSFTDKSLDETDRLGRRWYHWPLMIYRHVYVVVLFLAFLTIGLEVLIGSLRGPDRNPFHASLGVLVTLAVIALPVWVYRKKRRNRSVLLAKLNALKFSFTSEGISTAKKGGATSFEPWSSYSGFSQGKNIFILQRVASANRRTIPKDTLEPQDAERLRSRLLAHLPELR